MSQATLAKFISRLEYTNFSDEKIFFEKKLVWDLVLDLLLKQAQLYLRISVGESTIFFI